ncbi:hypothetical protein J8273_1762 [Carpediemonas membranifera]|uniref:Uncharacterized protein n=1 Tax=Carpediemonas membranifera TaxID=201153 RepID=A0A8J6E1S6_9EUKA|nr:hypothetical protein J8273_1762 [Carpediemonas membranifera]|eukprot:KAG9396744.1 hypothetical protein J8273_1762 [Carpediemonas membranifera]
MSTDMRPEPLKRLRLMLIYQALLFVVAFFLRLPLAFTQPKSHFLAITVGITRFSDGIFIHFLCILLFIVASLLTTPLIGLFCRPKTCIDSVLTMHAVYLIIALLLSPPLTLIGLVCYLVFMVGQTIATTAAAEYMVIFWKMRKGALSLQILGTG